MGALGLVAACVTWLPAAGQLTWDQLLGSSVMDPTVTAARERSDLIGSSDHAALWNDLELRTDIKRVDLLKQEFDLRVTPLAWGERSATRRMWKERSDLSAAQLDNGRAKATAERWHTGIRWIYQKRQLEYHRQLAQLYAARVKVLMSYAGDSRFDPQDLVASQQAEVEAQSEALGDESDIIAVEARLRAWVPGRTEVSLDTALLSSSELEKRIAALPLTADSTFPGWKISRTKLSLSESRVDLETASAWGLLSYLQVGYVWDRTVRSKTDEKNSGTFENVTAGFGIQIPIGDSRREDIARRKVDLAEARGDYAETNHDLVSEYEAKRAEVASLARQKAVLDSFAMKVDAGTLFADYARRSSNDPVLLSKARIISLESAWRSERLRYELCLDYLDMLVMTGELSRAGNRPVLLAGD